MYILPMLRRFVNNYEADASINDSEQKAFVRSTGGRTGRGPLNGTV